MYIGMGLNIPYASVFGGSAAAVWGSTPTLQGTTSNTATTADLTFTCPVNCSSGWLIIAHVHADGATAMSLPSGWKKIHQTGSATGGNNDGANHNYLSYYICDGTETTATTFTFTITENCSGTLAVISGQSPDIPFVLGTKTQTSDALTYYDHTWVADNTLHLAFAGGDSGSVTFDSAVNDGTTNWTEEENRNDGGAAGAHVGLWSKTQTGLDADGGSYGTALLHSNSASEQSWVGIFTILPELKYRAPVWKGSESAIASSTSVSLTIPSDIAAGDLALICFACDHNETITPHTDATELWKYDVTDALGTSGGQWYKELTAADISGGSITMTVGSTEQCAIIVHFFESGTFGTPTNVATPTNGTGTSLPLAQITCSTGSIACPFSWTGDGLAQSRDSNDALGRTIPYHLTSSTSFGNWLTAPLEYVGGASASTSYNETVSSIDYGSGGVEVPRAT